MKKFIITSAIGFLIVLTSIGCGKKEETYEEALQRSFEDAVALNYEQEYYDVLPTSDDKEELEKVRNDRILAGKILEAYLGRIMDSEVMFAEDYNASSAFINTFKDEAADLTKIDAYSCTASKKMAKELGVNNFDELKDMLKSENDCDEILICLTEDRCTVAFTKTDATGNKNVESPYPITAIGADSMIHKEQRKREGLE